jgi:hypothetical protein
MSRPRGRGTTGKTQRAALWLRSNPTASPQVAADLHGCSEGAVRTAWCRMFPQESLAASRIRVTGRLAPGH